VFPESDSAVVQVPPSPQELLRALIRYDTSNPPGNERSCLEYVTRTLANGRIESRLLALEPERPNLIARVPGRGDAPPLLLYGHIDVVPAHPSEWARPPFKAEVADGLIWGRGALDMKGGIAMLVCALMRVAAADTQPPGDIILALTSDEETGSRTGMEYLVERHASKFDGVRHALSEVGGYTYWHRDRQIVPIQVAEKQRCVIRATVRGIGGHPALPVPETASGKLGALLFALAKRRLPVHVTPIVRTVVDAIAEAMPLRDALLLRALPTPGLTNLLLRALGEIGALVDPLLHNTATPTLFRGGVASNVVPSELSVDLDGRVLPGLTPDYLVAELEMVAPRVAEYEIVHIEPTPPPQPNLDLFPLLARILRERDSDLIAVPSVLPGYTDARHVSRLGIQTYGFLPMRLPREITMALMHAPDERVPSETLDFGVDCLVEVIRRYEEVAR